jgi:hypothetical protein
MGGYGRYDARAQSQNWLWATAPEAAKAVLNVRCRYPLRQKRTRMFSVLNGGRSGSTSTPVHPDIICSITDMMRIATGSVDAIWSSHNIEHPQRHEVPVALREFFTVLKPRGLLLELPNLRQVPQLVVENRLEDRAYNSSSGPITPLDMIFGHWRRVTPSWRIAPVLLRGHCKGTCRSRLHRGQPA